MTKLLSQIHTITDGNIATPKGFHADGQHVGLKHKSKDLGWIYSDVPASVAGVFTTNQVQTAPVQLDKNVIQNGQIQAIIVNSGNANAVTGAIGLTHAKTMQAVTAAQLNISPELVAVSSTGVIGQPLPIDTVTAGIAQLNIDGDADSFAEAIKTTDTVKKTITIQSEIAGHQVTMSGVAKGSGMIHPNMATMHRMVLAHAWLPKKSLAHHSSKRPCLVKILTGDVLLQQLVLAALTLIPIS
ncbi:Glutamate N-acetyltransferase / N-acetylglutamate synthase [Leuconostoc pseudomesenteroides PS12]|nr:Glutamate N-acetyltransferase/N-acetylglutamate synthase [Leuconostoc pseudomesenteroides 1159]KDA49505.1 Glutamate N-acetyltransferase / N-acetylglutamate synthase [Leuconostoc pseudomesenteroides PS12]CCJ66188.1 Glutamate N-acetyltransferase / N-acetylglutamate synthase [Leuconostoc pseudomesenteroides 4882]